MCDYNISFPPFFLLFSQHLFASEHRDDIIRSAIEHAGNYIGITLRLRKEALTFEDFVTDRLGKYSSDESITSLAEFVVQKITPRHAVRVASPCSSHYLRSLSFFFYVSLEVHYVFNKIWPNFIHPEGTFSSAVAV